MISPRASIYGDVRVDESSRVDDFCVLSGIIVIGHHVHIACGCSLIGQVTMEPFSTLSGGVRVYGKSDDYTGRWMTNPTVPAHLTKIDERPVVIERHAIVGTNAVILPGVRIGEGAAIGAQAMITKDVAPWTIVVGRNKVLGSRRKDLLALEPQCVW